MADNNIVQQLQQQAMQEMKKKAKEEIKKAAANAMSQVWSAIAPALPYIAIAILILLVIVACTDWDDMGLTETTPSTSQMQDAKVEE